MDFGVLSFPAVVVVLVAAVVVQLARAWRGILIALAAQTLAVFLLTSLSWPAEMALVKLVSGWMAVAILAFASSEGAAASATHSSEASGSQEYWPETEPGWPSGRLFRLLACILVLLVVPSLTPAVKGSVPGIVEEQVWAALIMISLGLLHLGLTAHPLRVVAGLLTALAGFEIIYAVVEQSTLVAGLLAVSNLGIALAGAYLIIAPTIQERR